ncbi:hypothetical protein CPKG_00005 [Cyanophage KBS-S-2A]|uniref:hypothetical protein n=1 Tax=Cyanophage KBS-S-2A TaxID=889953 RepID=UPI0002C18F7D|nr:hypothetical protein CPKG_00005 [Cyanophage KBS-S-2A]AGH57636.1 hypothetical protein CPKG_00005 [Cyanophage KBS-S-2A]
MTTAFTWAVANLERETADGFVFTVHYTVNAEDGTYSAGAYGSIGLERPDSLIPFDDLTEDMVIGWVKDKFGDEKVAEIEAALQEQLDQKHSPTKAAGLPWS